MYFLKKAASRMPQRFQQSLKRWHYARSMRRGCFVSEEAEYQVLHTMIKPGDVAWDVGANVGCYTARMSELVGARGRVFAFEPIPDTFELLAANAQRFAYPNVSLFNMAASRESTLVSMEVPRAVDGQVRHHQARIVDAESAHRVFAGPLNAFVTERPVALVKIDAEGHEMSVLEGMCDVLLRDRPVLIIEASCPAIVDFVTRFGYSCELAKGSWNYMCRPAGAMRRENRAPLIPVSPMPAGWLDAPSV